MISLGLDEARRKEARALTYEMGSSMGLVAPPTTSGVTVSQATANTVTAYWNGICVISGDIGSMERHLYRKGAGNERERADDDPIAKLLQYPNPDTSAMQFWETITSHGVGWGNGFAEIEYDNASRPIGLWNITPDRVEVKVETFQDKRGRVTSVRFYLVDGKIRMEPWEMFHLPGQGFDGIRGYSPVSLFRQSLGLTLAAEKFGGALFGNGAWPGVALETEGRLTDEARERMRKAIADMHQGSEKAHRTLLLEGGLKVSKPITIPPDDAQFLETRGFQIEECARILNIMPHKLKHKVNERPGGNFEASELEYLVTTLTPWTTRIEQECSRKLISPERRKTLYVEHNYQQRLKTDTGTRMASYKTLFDMGVMDAELIAQKENLPKPKPQEAPPEPEQPKEPAEPPEQDDQPRRQRLVAAQRAMLESVIVRYRKRESEDAQRAAKRGAERFQEWVEGFYAPHEVADLGARVAPALGLCLAAAGSAADAEGLAGRWSQGYIQVTRESMLSLKTSELRLAAGRFRPVAAVVDDLMAAVSAAQE